MDAPYTVGALARQAGVTPKTMRFYEAISYLHEPSSMSLL
jgi:DNA-binding transcriptional MerR regulator